MSKFISKFIRGIELVAITFAFCVLAATVARAGDLSWIHDDQLLSANEGSNQIITDLQKQRGLLSRGVNNVFTEAEYSALVSKSDRLIGNLIAEEQLIIQARTTLLRAHSAGGLAAAPAPQITALQSAHQATLATIQDIKTFSSGFTGEKKKVVDGVTALLASKASKDKAKELGLVAQGTLSPTVANLTRDLNRAVTPPSAPTTGAFGAPTTGGVAGGVVAAPGESSSPTGSETPARNTAGSAGAGPAAPGAGADGLPAPQTDAGAPGGSSGSTDGVIRSDPARVLKL